MTLNWEKDPRANKVIKTQKRPHLNFSDQIHWSSSDQAKFEKKTELDLFNPGEITKRSHCLTILVIKKRKTSRQTMQALSKSNTGARWGKRKVWLKPTLNWEYKRHEMFALLRISCHQPWSTAIPKIGFSVFSLHRPKVTVRMVAIYPFKCRQRSSRNLFICTGISMLKAAVAAVTKIFPQIMIFVHSKYAWKSIHRIRKSPRLATKKASARHLPSLPVTKAAALRYCEVDEAHYTNRLDQCTVHHMPVLEAQILWMKSISTSRIPAKRNAISTWYSYDIKTPK